MLFYIDKRSLFYFALERDVGMHTSIAGFHINTPGYSPKELCLSKITQSKEKKKDIAGEEPVIYENGRGTVSQEEIEQFKETNSPENDKISQIYGKFRAGKELSGEELDYLARYSPELYQEVKEVIMERKALEMRMKMAKTKLEVNAAITNSAANIKKTMGTGEQAKRQAMKTMARVNQTNDAGIKFKASVEYKEKDDEKTRAEDVRAELEEQEELLKAQEEILKEQREIIEEQKEEFLEEPDDGADEAAEARRPDDNSRTENQGRKAVTEEPEVTVKDIADEEKRAKRRRAQRRNTQNNEGDSGIKEPIKVVTREELRRRFEMAGSGGIRVDIKL